MALAPTLQRCIHTLTVVLLNSLLWSGDNFSIKKFVLLINLRSLKLCQWIPAWFCLKSTTRLSKTLWPWKSKMLKQGKFRSRSYISNKLSNDYWLIKVFFYDCIGIKQSPSMLSLLISMEFCFTFPTLMAINQKSEWVVAHAFLERDRFWLPLSCMFCRWASLWSFTKIFRSMVLMNCWSGNMEISSHHQKKVSIRKHLHCTTLEAKFQQRWIFL